MTKRNILLRLFSVLWTGADALRKLLHLLLLLFITLLVVGTLLDEPYLMPKRAALVIQPNGALVEQLEGDPFDRAVAELFGDSRPDVLVQDIVDALEFAAADDRIEAVYFELSKMFGSGLGKTQRIAAAIHDFRASGKPVIASADFLDQSAYYLAAQASNVYLHPDGALLLRGYGQFRTFYKDVIDKLLVDWNIFRVGTHKTFVEPFTRMDMSDEDRESTSRLIDQLWGMYQDGVTMARDLDSDSIQDFTTDLVGHLERAEGDLAKAALEQGLVDELLTRGEVRDRLIDIVGADVASPDMFNAVGMGQYLEQMRLVNDAKVAEKNVAIVVAAGAVFFGERAPGSIGADTISNLLRRVKNDDSIGALVIRVDSPGGSAFAADVINDEIESLRDAGKPVVASMGSVAASAGYSISMIADHVIAEPATITGSIGVFAMFPTYQRTLGALGVANDGVGTTPWSGQFRPDREMSSEAKRLMQMVVENAYNDFVTDVARQRDLDKGAVDRVGQGQVWTGIDALNFGLVDELGSLESAIAAAARLAGLEEGEYGTKLIETDLSVSEQIMLDLLTFAAEAGVDLRSLIESPGPIEGFFRGLDRRAEDIFKLNDPQGIYKHCLCESIY